MFFRLKTTHSLAVLAFLFLFIFILRPAYTQNGCSWCERRAVMGDADAGKTGVQLKESLYYRLAETLTSPCFHLLGDPRISKDEMPNLGSRYHPPEYVFTGKFEADMNTPQEGGKKGSSRLTINLYYNGQPQELVQTWSVDSTTYTFTSCTNRMFKNDNAVMKQARPIENILWDFEQAPKSCKVEFRLKVTELGRGQKWDIDLSEFKDGKGRDSKHFNRIVVKAKEGEILNGETCEDDSKAKAFKVGDGYPEIKYKAPEKKGITEDTITVYNSCEICPEGAWPMSKTPKKDKIGEKTIKIYGGDYNVNIKITRTWNFNSGSMSHEGEFRMTISGALKKMPESRYPLPTFEPMGMMASWSFKSKETEDDPPKDCPKLLCQYSGSGNFSPERSSNSMLYVHYFKNLGTVGERAAQMGMIDYYEVVLAQPPSSGKMKMPGKERGKNGPCQTYGDDTLTKDSFTLNLRFKMSKDTDLSGSQSWSSNSDSNSLSCSDLGEGKPFRAKPFKPPKSGDHYHYTVTWSITKSED